jgi:hypothetical protein
MKNNKTTAENLEARFDRGEDVSGYFNVRKAFRRNGRERDRDGQIREKRGDTLVGTLRKEYGADFAKGYRSDTKLETVREDTGKSLSQLVKGK